MKNRHLYPQNWTKISSDYKTRVAIKRNSYDDNGNIVWLCEKCGVLHNARKTSSKSKMTYVVKIASAHLDHDPWDANARLASLCQACHMTYDYSKEQVERKKRIESEHALLMQQEKSNV